MNRDRVVIVDDPGGTGRSGSMFCWIVEHGPGDEGIAGLNGMPLVAMKVETLLQFARPMQGLATKQRKPVKLARFDFVEVVRRIEP